MRVHHFIPESAIQELAHRLPTLKRTDYNAIHSLMRQIGQKHNIHIDDLHSLFVKKYGHEPMHWIKQIKQRNEEVNEGDVIPFSKPGKQVPVQRTVNRKQGNVTPLKPSSKPNTGITKKGDKMTGPTLHSIYEDPEAGFMPFNEEDDMDEGVFDFFKGQPKKPPMRKPSGIDYNAVRMASGGNNTRPASSGQRYGRPDEYYKAKRNQDFALAEDSSVHFDEAQINKFIQWTIRRLHIKQPFPKFTFSDDTEKAQQGHHTGVHTPDDNHIWVYVGNRNMVDIMRTVFHELVHERQMQLGMIEPGDSYPGSPIEAMADMLAGKYIKIYGKQHPEIFQ